MLDRAAERIDPDRKLSAVADDEIGDALTELWGATKPATWNRNRAAIGSWLAWCTDKQHWTAPELPASVERQREPEDTTKAVSRSRIDRLRRRRDQGEAVFDGCVSGVVAVGTSWRPSPVIGDAQSKAGATSVWPRSIGPRRAGRRCGLLRR